MACARGRCGGFQVPDLDWAAHRIHVIRSKSGQHEVLPLEPSVEHAVRRYLDARPPTDQATLFLTVRAPFRPLSAAQYEAQVPRDYLPALVRWQVWYG